MMSLEEVSQHTMQGTAVQVLTLDGRNPAHHAGNCLSSGHFGRGKPSIPCRKLPLKWSFGPFGRRKAPSAQHAMQAAAFQVVTLHGVGKAYHAESCLSSDHFSRNSYSCHLYVDFHGFSIHLYMFTTEAKHTMQGIVSPVTSL